jgi:hypothetical protein
MNPFDLSSSDPQQQPGTSEILRSPSSSQRQGLAQPHDNDCDCSDDEMTDISEKRQSIFDFDGPGPSGHCQMRSTQSKSASTVSSFEEIVPSTEKLSDDSWQVINKTSSNCNRNENDDALEDPTTSSNKTKAFPESDATTRNKLRRRSDSSLLDLRKTGCVKIDAISTDPIKSFDDEIKRVKICNKCGKAKLKIESEFIKLCEQLKTSKKSEAEVSAKIKEFLDYLESKSQHSELTVSENYESTNFIATSNSNDEIEEIGASGLVALGAENIHQEPQLCINQSSTNSTPRRFISINEINTR